MNHRTPRLRASSTLRRAFAAAILTGSILTVCTAHAQQIGDVFYIEMENHNWVQPNGNVNNASSTIEQIFGNAAAPYINSLVTPGNANAAQVSYASSYYNVLSTPSGGTSVHPSEPNYVWQEAGSNFGIGGDADPGTGTGASYPNGNNFSTSTQSLSNLLQTNSMTWRAYAEDSQLGSNAGIVPIHSTSGTNGPVNPYYGTTQFNFAPKHVGQLFFQNTNSNSTNLSNYAPMSQLATDLTNNTVARYNVITPNQFNDMHSALSTDFTYNGVTYTHGTDAEQIALGDNYLSQVVPLIMASQAYRNNGAIVIWNDESESQGTGDTNPNNYTHSLMEIVISPLARGNAYTNSIVYDHTSDVRTLQEVFGVGPAQGDAFLGQAATDPAGQNDLGDLFQTGVIQTVPEPSTWVTVIGGLGMLILRRRTRVA